MINTHSLAVGIGLVLAFAVAPNHAQQDKASSRERAGAAAVEHDAHRQERVRDPRLDQIGRAHV